MSASDLTDCDPIIYNKDINKTLYSVSNTLLASSDPAIPCGLVAKSVFTDNYTLSLGSTPVTINEKNIAWDSDKQYKFNNIQNLPSGVSKWQDIQWLDMTDGKILIFLD